VVTPRPFNAPVGFNPRVDSLTQVNRDAAVAAERLRQMQAVRSAQTVRGVTTAGRGLNLLRTGTSLSLPGLVANLGLFAIPPAVQALGDFRKSDQGELVGDRLRQGNFGGAFQALFSPRANKPNPLQQYNPPGFDPKKEYTLDDVSRLAQNVLASPNSRILGTRDGVTPDRTQSDDYRQYAGTPEAQFKAIFQDRALGGYGDLSKAKGAPKDAQGMLELARQTTAPMGTDLNAYYAAQRGAGEIRKDQLVEYFGQRSQGLGEWAKANPALAYRQFIKESSSGGQMDAGTVAALKTIGEAEVDKSSIGDRVENFLKYTAKAKNPLAPDETGYYETMGDQPTIGDFPIK